MPTPRTSLDGVLTAINDLRESIKEAVYTPGTPNHGRQRRVLNALDRAEDTLVLTCNSEGMPDGYFGVDFPTS